MTPFSCCNGTRVIVLSGLLALCLVVFIACGEAPPVDPGPPDQTYDLRGKVVQLPNDRQKELSIYHESVPDFIGADGEVVGMDGMTMPFAVAASESLEGIEKGDKIAFQLEVRWDGDEVVTVRQIEKLPPETQLDFERPESEEATGADVPEEASASEHDHATHMDDSSSSQNP